MARKRRLGAGIAVRHGQAPPERGEPRGRAAGTWHRGVASANAPGAMTRRYTVPPCPGAGPPHWGAITPAASERTTCTDGRADRPARTSSGPQHRVARHSLTAARVAPPRPRRRRRVDVVGARCVAGVRAERPRPLELAASGRRDRPSVHRPGTRRVQTCASRRPPPGRRLHRLGRAVLAAQLARAYVPPVGWVERHGAPAPRVGPGRAKWLFRIRPT
jgi:hypothetical protein